MATTEHLLKDHKIRITPIRKAVIRLFLDKDHALTHQFIEQHLTIPFDRVTLYRTLKTFEDKGVIHRIVNDKDTIEYALCKDQCGHNDHKHMDNHLHFQCEACKKTFCLEEINIPSINIPENYSIKTVQMLAVGTCERCQE